MFAFGSQESEPLLLKALESLQRATDLLEVICNLRDWSDSSPSSSSSRVQQSLIELGRVWQAPLYEITLKFHPSDERNEGGCWILLFQFMEIFIVQIFWSENFGIGHFNLNDKS